MKKILFIVAVATLFFASCEKEILTSDQNTQKAPCFRASIEQLTPDTKAAINESNQLEWAENDKIGIYFPTWGDKNQAFTLSEGKGSTKGSFTRDHSGDYSPTDAAFAYFPWQGTAYGDNNIYDDPDDNPDKGPVMYFTLKNWYDDYTTSGKMLTPLVASISSAEDITFKHAGAAVKLTINNLVSGGYTAKMTVYNKQITGSFKMNPVNAGTDAMVVNGDEDTDKNHITLNSWKGSGAFSWLFPVPELTNPKLKFEITDANGFKVWSKSLAAQENSLGRGEILVMPDLDITPYAQFVQDNSCVWSFSGTINGSAWTDNVPMVSDGRYWILAGQTFKSGDKFKIRKDKKWAFEGGEEYGGAEGDWVFTKTGAQDIIFDSTNHTISVVDRKFPYPASDLSSLAASITIDGTMTDWTFHTLLTSTGTSHIRSWKFTSDEDNLYFYLVLRKNKMRTAYGLTIAFDWNSSGSYSGDNLSAAEALVVFQPFTNSDNSDGTKPTCVNGAINNATINSSAVANASINAYGLNPDTSANGDSADYYLEFSIPKSKIPSLPSSGSIKIGIGHEWYNTSYQSVTL